MTYDNRKKRKTLTITSVYGLTQIQYPKATRTDGKRSVGSFSCVPPVRANYYSGLGPPLHLEETPFCFVSRTLSPTDT